MTNNNAKARFGRSAEFASENVKIEERYIFDNGGERYNYVATFTDPTVYTRSWTATIPARRFTEKDKAGRLALRSPPRQQPRQAGGRRVRRAHLRREQRRVRPRGRDELRGRAAELVRRAASDQ